MSRSVVQVVSIALISTLVGPTATAWANETLASDIRDAVEGPSAADADDGMIGRRPAYASAFMRARAQEIQDLGAAARKARDSRSAVLDSMATARKRVLALEGALEAAADAKAGPEAALTAKMSDLRAAARALPVDDVRQATGTARQTANAIRKQLGLQDEVPAFDAADVEQSSFSRLLEQTAQRYEQVDEGLAALNQNPADEIRRLAQAYDDAVAAEADLSNVAEAVRTRSTDAALAFAEYGVDASEAAEAKDRSLFVRGLEKFKSLGLSLREANEPVGRDRPATFNYTRNYRPDRDAGQPSEKITTQAALIWTGKPQLWFCRPNNRLSVLPQVALETDIDTGRGKTKDQISLYAGVQLLHNLTKDEFRGWYKYTGRSTVILPLQVQLHYLTSTNGRYEELNAHLDFAPKIGALAMGVRRGHEYGCCPTLGTAAKGQPRFWRMPKNFISFMWQPRMAWDFGTVIDSDPAIARTNDTIVRGVFDISARIYFDGFARGLFYQSYKSKVGPLGSVWDQALMPYFEVGYKLFWEDNLPGDDVNEYLQLIFNVPLNKAISFDLKYRKGRDAPAYLYVEELGIAIGIKL